MTTVPPTTAEEEEELSDEQEEPTNPSAGRSPLEHARQLVAALPAVMRPGEKHLPELAAALGRHLAAGWTVPALARRLAKAEKPDIRMPAKYLLTCLSNLEPEPEPEPGSVPRAYCGRHPATLAAECGTCRAERAIRPQAPGTGGSVAGIDAFRQARAARTRRPPANPRGGTAHEPAAG